MHAHEPRLYLASRSPRRGELLAQIGVSFEVLAADTDERVQAGESPERYVRRVALEKASAARERLGHGDPGIPRSPKTG